MKKLSNLLLVLMATFAFVACNKHEDLIPIQPETQEHQTSESATSTLRSITQDQASDFAQKVYNAIKQSKRPGKKDLNSSSEVFAPMAEATVASVLPISKNGTNVIYIVNFGVSNGYMVISADKATKWAMLAFSDTGSIDNLQQLNENNPFKLWLDQKSQETYERLQQPIPISKRSLEFWNALGRNAEKDTEIDIEFVGEDEFRVNSEGLRGTHKDSKGLPYIGVYSFISDCVWGQGQGYNADAKVPNALAGCPAVAIGILCCTIHFPNKYPYSEMPIKVETASSNPVSRMLRDIADHIPNYKWGVNVSGATAPNILTGLRALGFSNATYASYDFDRAYDQIKRSHPVLLAGFDSRGGHIWISDGYWEQRWKVTKKFLWWVVDTWYEYSDMLYMNWGWNGSGNGWIDQESWPHFGNSRIMFYNLHQ